MRKGKNMKIENGIQRLEEVRVSEVGGAKAEGQGVMAGMEVAGTRERTAGSQSGVALRLPPHSKSWRSEGRTGRAGRNAGVKNVGVTSKHVQNTDGFWE